MLVAGYLIILHAGLIWLAADKYVLSRSGRGEISRDMIRDPVQPPQVVPTELPLEMPEPRPEPSFFPTPESAEPEPVQPQASPAGAILIPVQGITAEQLQDTYTASRSENRVHNAIDIMAPVGTPVVAAVDGEIVKFHDSMPGGITIYQSSADRRFFFYYAHLQRRADGISEKQFVTRGTTIGYVGDTGNAGAGNFHLHFSISIARDPSRFWDGESINPYPILKGTAPLPQ